MDYILVMIWLNYSQSYKRDTITWNEVHSIEFESEKACTDTMNLLIENTKGIKYICVPKRSK